MDFSQTLAHWDEPHFDAIFRKEVLALDPQRLPLQQGLRHSSHALTDDLEVVVLSRHAEEEHREVRAGVFYRGVIAGCSCADDPTPQDEITEYCELRFVIQSPTGEVQIELL